MTQDNPETSTGSAAALWPCFRCEPGILQAPAGSPPDWVPPTMRLCRRHDPARVASGRPLVEVLEARNVCRRSDRRVEWLLNPVVVEGQRAWFSLAINSYRVQGEAFASHDPFEYFAQHDAQTSSELLALHKHREIFARGADARALARYYRARVHGARHVVPEQDGKQEEAGPFDWFRRLWERRPAPVAQPTRLDRLCRYWSYRREFLALRNRVDPSRTLREEQVIDHARQIEFPWQAPASEMRLEEVIPDLLALAARRYGG